MKAPLTASTVGLRIAQSYKLEGMNRRQFSMRTGLDYATIMKWEKGESSPQLESLKRVADATGRTVSELTDLPVVRKSERRSDLMRYAAKREQEGDPVDDAILEVLQGKLAAYSGEAPSQMIDGWVRLEEAQQSAQAPGRSLRGKSTS